MEKKYRKHEDDFGSFLSSVQSAMKQQKASGDTPVRIIRTLAQANKKEKVVKVMIDVKASWNEFNEGLKYLEDVGFVRLDDDDDGSNIRLTKDGAQFARSMLDASDD